MIAFTLNYIPFIGPFIATLFPTLLSMLPSTTEASRTSLLSGAATRGNASAERTAFSAHPALLALSVAGKPPVIFVYDTDIRGEVG